MIWKYEFKGQVQLEIISIKWKHFLLDINRVVHYDVPKGAKMSNSGNFYLQPQFQSGQKNFRNVKIIKRY